MCACGFHLVGVKWSHTHNSEQGSRLMFNGNMREASKPPYLWTTESPFSAHSPSARYFPRHKEQNSPTRFLLPQCDQNTDVAGGAADVDQSGWLSHFSVRDPTSSCGCVRMQACEQHPRRFGLSRSEEGPATCSVNSIFGLLSFMDHTLEPLD